MPVAETSDKFSPGEKTVDSHAVDTSLLYPGARTVDTSKKDKSPIDTRDGIIRTIPLSRTISDNCVTDTTVRSVSASSSPPVDWNFGHVHPVIPAGSRSLKIYRRSSALGCVCRPTVRQVIYHKKPPLDSATDPLLVRSNSESAMLRSFSTPESDLLPDPVARDELDWLAGNNVTAPSFDQPEEVRDSLPSGTDTGTALSNQPADVSVVSVDHFSSVLHSGSSVQSVPVEPSLEYQQLLANNRRLDGQLLHLQSTLEAATKEKADLQFKLAHLEAHNRVISSSLQSVSAGKEETIRELSTLKATSRAADQKVQLLSRDLQYKTNECSTQKVKLEAIQKTADQLRRTAIEQEVAREEKNGVVKALKEKVSEQQVELEQVRQERVRLISEKSSSTKNNAFSVERDYLSEQLNAAKKEHQQLSEDLRRMVDQRLEDRLHQDALRRENDSLSHKVVDLQHSFLKEKTQFLKQLEKVEIEQRQRESELLRKTVAERDGNAASNGVKVMSELEWKRFSQLTTRADVMEIELNSSKTENQSLRDRLLSLESDRKDLSRRVVVAEKSLEERDATIEFLNARLQKSGVRVNELTDKVSVLSESSFQLKTSLVEMDRLRAELKALTHETSSLKKTVVNLRAKNAAEEQKNQSVSREVNQLKLSFSSATENIAELTGSLSETRTLLADATASAAALQGSLESVARDLETTQAAYRSTRQELELVAKQEAIWREHSAAWQTYSEQISVKAPVSTMTVQTDEDDTNHRMETIRTEEWEKYDGLLQAESVKHQQQIHKLESQATERYGRYEQACSDIQQELNQSLDENDVLSREIDSLKKRLLEAEHQLETATGKADQVISQHTSEIAERDDVISRKQAEFSAAFNALVEEKSGLTSEIFRLSSELLTAQSQINPAVEKGTKWQEEISRLQKQLADLSSERDFLSEAHSQLTTEVTQTLATHDTQWQNHVGEVHKFEEEMRHQAVSEVQRLADIEIGRLISEVQNSTDRLNFLTEKEKSDPAVCQECSHLKRERDNLSQTLLTQTTDFATMETALKQQIADLERKTALQVTETLPAVSRAVYDSNKSSDEMNDELHSLRDHLTILLAERDAVTLTHKNLTSEMEKAVSDHDLEWRSHVAEVQKSAEEERQHLEHERDSLAQTLLTRTTEFSATETALKQQISNLEQQIALQTTESISAVSSAVAESNRSNDKMKEELHSLRALVTFLQTERDSMTVAHNQVTAEMATAVADHDSEWRLHVAAVQTAAEEEQSHVVEELQNKAREENLRLTANIDDLTQRLSVLIEVDEQRSSICQKCQDLEQERTRLQELLSSRSGEHEAMEAKWMFQLSELNQKLSEEAARNVEFAASEQDLEGKINRLQSAVTALLAERQTERNSALETQARLQEEMSLVISQHDTEWRSHLEDIKGFSTDEQNRVITEFQAVFNSEKYILTAEVDRLTALLTTQGDRLVDGLCPNCLDMKRSGETELRITDAAHFATSEDHRSTPVKEVPRKTFNPAAEVTSAGQGLGNSVSAGLVSSPRGESPSLRDRAPAAGWTKNRSTAEKDIPFTTELQQQEVTADSVIQSELKSTVQNLIEELSASRNIVDEQAQEVQTLRDEVNALRFELDAAKMESSHLRDLTAQQDEEWRAFATATQELSDAKFNALTNECDAKKNELVESEQRLQALEHQKADIETRLSEAIARGSKLDELTSLKTAEADSLSRQLEIVSQNATNALAQQENEWQDYYQDVVTAAEEERVRLVVLVTTLQKQAESFPVADGLSPGTAAHPQKSSSVTGMVTVEEPIYDQDSAKILQAQNGALLRQIVLLNERLAAREDPVADHLEEDAKSEVAEPNTTLNLKDGSGDAFLSTDQVTVFDGQSEDQEEGAVLPYPSTPSTGGQQLAMAIDLEAVKYEYEQRVAAFQQDWENYATIQTQSFEQEKEHLNQQISALSTELAVVTAAKRLLEQVATSTLQPTPAWSSKAVSRSTSMEAIWLNFGETKEQMHEAEFKDRATTNPSIDLQNEADEKCIGPLDKDAVEHPVETPRSTCATCEKLILQLENNERSIEILHRQLVSFEKDSRPDRTFFVRNSDTSLDSSDALFPDKNCRDDDGGRVWEDEVGVYGSVSDSVQEILDLKEDRMRLQVEILAVQEECELLRQKLSATEGIVHSDSAGFIYDSSEQSNKSESAKEFAFTCHPPISLQTGSHLADRGLLEHSTTIAVAEGPISVARQEQSAQTDGGEFVMGGMGSDTVTVSSMQTAELEQSLQQWVAYSLDVQSQLTRVQALNTELQANLDTFREAASDGKESVVDTEDETLKLGQLKFDQVENEIKVLKSELERSTNSSLELESFTESLRNQLNESTDEVAQLESERSKLVNQLTELRSDHAGECAIIRGTFQATIESLDCQLDEARDHLEILRQSNSDISHQLSTQMTGTDQQIVLELSMTLEKEKSRALALEHTRDQLQSYIEQLNQKIIRQADYEAKLEKSCGESDLRVEELLMERDQMAMEGQDDIRTLKDELDRAGRDREAARVEREKLMERVSALEAKDSEHVGQITSLRKKYGILKEKFQASQALTESRKLALTQLEKALAVSQDDLEEYKLKLIENEKKIGALETEIESLNHEVERRQTLHDSFRERVSNGATDLDREIQGLREHLQTREGDFQRLEESMDKLRKQRDDTKLKETRRQLRNGSNQVSPPKGGSESDAKSGRASLNGDGVFHLITNGVSTKLSSLTGGGSLTSSIQKPSASLKFCMENLKSEIDELKSQMDLHMQVVKSKSDRPY